jgi:hypothetical protein
MNYLFDYEDSKLHMGLWVVIGITSSLFLELFVSMLDFSPGRGLYRCFAW